MGLAVLSQEAEKKRSLHWFGAWLTVALTGHGFRVDASPGRAVRAVRDGAVLQPFLLVNDLAEGKLSAARFRERCAELGLP